MPITTLGIGAAVTPTVVKTTFSHYTNRKPRAQKPTAHISYDQGLHLIQSFLLYASHHTVEEVQAFTAQWVPHPSWVRLENVHIPEASITKAVELLVNELGEQGVQEVGGKKWWQWRKKDVPLRAEWIEMRSDYNLRQKQNKKCRRIMMYIHGGAYFFGSVDEHRYQLQRHARKLNARVFAPRYRLAPQFPFPCGLLDCLAAYIYLLTVHEPSEIILAGDSAGGGMILSILCLLRDQGIDLPAGAILISPWVDLTHSFPSLSRTDGFDYIPAHGFMQKPSRSWPPPTADEIQEIVKTGEGQRKKSAAQDKLAEADILPADPTILNNKAQAPLSLQLDGKNVIVKDQIQLYTTNQLITHPLVSPVLQPSLGGLPPLLIMVGGGEMLRDEQIYVAHKAADPQKYKLNDIWRARYDPDDKIVNRYKPTPVQLQVWEDLCHVTPTLSFTRPAKFMYRSVAQFGAWALSRAQKRAIEIMSDDNSSVDSLESDELDDPKFQAFPARSNTPNGLHTQIGKAGDPIPPFRNNMVREQVDRNGNIYPLPPPSQLPAMQMSSELIGVVKEGPIRHWLNAKQQWDSKYASKRRKIMKQRVESYKAGNRLSFGQGENPPSCALAARQQDEEATKPTRTKKSWGLGMWSSWGWKHDERTLQRDEEFTKQEEKAEKESGKKGIDDPETPAINTDGPPNFNRERSESQTHPRARRKTVTVLDEGQIEGERPQPKNSMSSALDVPPVVVEPAIDPNVSPSESNHLSPAPYMPKWKTANHLRDGSKDMSDSGSTYSRRTIPDNASTTAVFSAPGVSRLESEADEAQSPYSPGSQTFDSRSHSYSHSHSHSQSQTHPDTGVIKDHVGGYDTPGSNRSVERLQSHQVDVSKNTAAADGASVHSSVLTQVTKDKTHPLPMRNASSMAIVQAEGIISARGDREVAERDSTGLAKDVDETEAVQNRPGLYARDDSTFVTAMERL